MTRLCVLLLMVFFSALLKAQTQKEIDDFFEELANKPCKLIDQPIPPFKGYSSDKKFYSQDSLQNKITVLHFWFEACVPCMTEMEDLNKLYWKFRTNSQFQFLSFTSDNSVTIERVKAKYKIEYPIISISRDSCITLNFKSGFPTNVISDKKGKVAYYHMGKITHSYPILEKMLKKEE